MSYTVKGLEEHIKKFIDFLNHYEVDDEVEFEFDDDDEVEFDDDDEVDDDETILTFDEFIKNKQLIEDICTEAERSGGRILE